MANILINGLSAKVGGGKSILNNYLCILAEEKSRHQYFILTPEKKEYLKYENNFITIIDIHPSFLRYAILIPYVYRFTLPGIIETYRIDSVFNLADTPIVTSKTPQIFLFDWSYAVYPESPIWSMVDLKTLLMIKVKLYFFRRQIKYVKTLIAQTNPMKKKLKKLYGIGNIEVIPNAVSPQNMSGGTSHDFKLPDGIKLLYLTHYYPHKNIEIFIPLAKKIKSKGLDFKIITTISGNHHRGAKKFLTAVRDNSLEDIIVNIGTVNMEQVPSIYQQCDALLIPTLLESFSGTYVEAMYHKTPILTSNLDFAISVCAEAGVYFDPLDENSILTQIELVFSDDKFRETKIKMGTRIINDLPDWHQAVKLYNELINKSLTEQKFNEHQLKA